MAAEAGTAAKTVKRKHTDKKAANFFMFNSSSNSSGLGA